MEVIDEKFEPFTLILTCWFYLAPAKVAEHSKLFTELLRQKLPCAPRWEIDILHSKEYINQDVEKLFAPLELVLTTVKGGMQSRLDLYETIWSQISKILRDWKTKTRIGLKYRDSLICWSLREQTANTSTNFNRLVLPIPTKPINLPAERVEQVLYNLVHVKYRQSDARHKNCTKNAVFLCLENQLYQQKQEFHLLRELLGKVYTQDEPCSPQATLRTITAIENLDKTLHTLVQLIEERVGKGRQCGQGGCVLMSKLRQLFKKKAVVPIVVDEEVETAKVQVRRDLQCLQRITPLLAYHVRLSQREHRHDLLRVCHAAPEGPEQTEMVDKMGIPLSRIHKVVDRTSTLARVRDAYLENYATLLADIETLNKAVGSIYKSFEVEKSEKKVSKCGH